jgi:catechol 2,3-dioxygenase-like lactoylglutathione lyase family enzyme
MEVLASRLILHPSDMAQSRHFYEQVLGLRIFHEYGDRSAVIGVVYFLGGGFPELSGATPRPGKRVLDALAPGAGCQPGGDAPARPRRSPRGAGLAQGLGA